MKNVLWISRHTMTPAQEADLTRIAGGEIVLHQYDETVKDAEVLRPLIEDADIICAVLPIGMMAQVRAICGDRPLLQARSARVATGKIITLPDGRTEREIVFQHVCWEKIVRLEYEIEVL